MSEDIGELFYIAFIVICCALFFIVLPVMVYQVYKEEREKLLHGVDISENSK